MKATSVDPPRWKDGSGDPGALAARAADLVEAVRDVPALPPEALARIRREVLARGSARAGWGRSLTLRFALLALVLLASGATAKATMVLWQRYTAAREAARASAHRGAAAARPRPRPPATEIVPLPSLRPVVVRASAPHPRRVATAAPAEVRVTPAPPPETEAQLLGRALSLLRQVHDPAGAVALLDQYGRTFPHGTLEAEAASARLEAAIQMDDRPTALRLLDGKSAFTGRLGSQQLLTRAELRASAARYADALADFDRLLAPQGVAVPADLERALYGRAVCLGRLGEAARARADLAAYARQFPDGKHAAEVARLLAGSRPAP
jgi:hypothetical protein